MEKFINTGEHLRKVRKFLKVKSYELSLKSQMFNGYVANIESGRVNTPRLTALESICERLNKIRKKHNYSIEFMRNELGENVVLDFMEMLEAKEERASNTMCSRPAMTYSSLLDIFKIKNEMLSYEIMDYRPAGAYSIELYLRTGVTMTVFYDYGADEFKITKVRKSGE